MSAQRAETAAAAGITYLEQVPDDKTEQESPSEQLRRELDTERNANQALLAAIMELDARLADERENGASWRSRAMQAELLVMAEARKSELTGSRWHRLGLGPR